MAHYSKEVKDQVRKKYVFEQLSLASVAVLVDVPYGTVARWKKQAKERGDDWDKARSAHLLADDGIESVAQKVLPRMIRLFDTVTEQVEQDDISGEAKAKIIASLTDSFHKAVSSNRKIMPETDELAIALKVLNLQKQHIAENYPELTNDFHEVLSSFGEVLAKELNK